MSKITISNFRYGLDTRRCEIEQQPGTLAVGRDGHINQGGEFEKRQKFVRQTLGQRGAFGLEVTDAGFVVFGSDDNAILLGAVSVTSGVATITTATAHPFLAGDRLIFSGVVVEDIGLEVVTVLATPTSSSFTFATERTDLVEEVTAPGLTVGLSHIGVYQRLQHPLVLATLVKDAELEYWVSPLYDAAKHAMAKVRWSTSFGGKAFVIAEFADGHAYAYYDGVLVSDFTAGLVLTDGTSNEQQALNLAALVDQTADFTGTSPAVGGVNQADIQAAYGNNFVVTTTKDPTTTAGTLVANVRSNEVAATPGTGAQASFRIIAGTASPGVNKITNIQVGSDFTAPNLVAIIGEAVDWATSNADTAQVVVNAINNYTSDPEYRASKLADVVTIIGPEGTAQNSFVLRVTTAGDVCVETCGIELGTDVTEVSSIIADPDGANTELLNTTPITKSGSTAAFCAAVAAAIRAKTTTGFTACAGGTGIFISRLVANSNAAAVPIRMTYVTTGTPPSGGDPDPPPSSLAATLVHLSLYATKAIAKLNGSATVSTENDHASGQPGQGVCNGSGGVPPYTTYLWEPVSTGSDNGIVIESPNSQTTGFHKLLTMTDGVDESVQGHFKCSLADSDTPPNTATTGTVIYLTVTLVLTSSL